jgi:hypothetical protein
LLLLRSPLKCTAPGPDHTAFPVPFLEVWFGDAFESRSPEWSGEPPADGCRNDRFSSLDDGGMRHLAPGAATDAVFGPVRRKPVVFAVLGHVVNELSGNVI